MFSARKAGGFVAALAVLNVTTAAAQTEGPKFEVSSVRACSAAPAPEGGGPKGGRGGGVAASSPVTLNFPCLPLRFYINLAFVISNAKPGIPSPILEGGPAWIDSERYHITAKAAAAISKEEMNGPMLQALLQERFRLKVHLETREVPVYHLTVAASGLKLRPWDGSSCVPRDPAQASTPPGEKPWCGLSRARREAHGIQADLPGGTMAQFAQTLGQSGRMVVDRTGISEKFDFHIEYSPEGVDSGDDNAAPTVFAALARFGLKLEPAKGSREFLVIDHVERPSAN